MRLVNGTRGVFAAAAAAFALAAAGCQSATETSNTVANTNGNSTVNINGSNANMTTTTVQTNTGQTIEAKEPDKYTATMVATLAAAGQPQQQQRAQAEVKVARNGADRRYSVNVPVAGELVFLDKADKRYVIMHGRKEYAELTQEMTGVNVDQLRSMTPGQLVALVTKQQGVTLVGEETFNGRPAVKYRAVGGAQTQTTAGQVKGETFIYVDKETGLPLRIEGFGQSTGNVQGITGGNIVIETRDLKTDVNPADFEIPQGYKQLSPEEVRQRVQVLAQGLQALMAFINSQQSAGTAPAVVPSPTATPGR